MPDLLIDVEARALSARLDRLETYTQELSDKLAPLLPPRTRFAVWFKLYQGSWQARQL